MSTQTESIELSSISRHSEQEDGAQLNESSLAPVDRGFGAWSFVRPLRFSFLWINVYLWLSSWLHLLLKESCGVSRTLLESFLIVCPTQVFHGQTLIHQQATLTIRNL